MILRTAILLAAAGAALAWLGGGGREEALIKTSSDIAVVECKRSETTPEHWLNGLPEADAEVISTLKGTLKLGPVKLFSGPAPWPGRTYLIFGTCHTNFAKQTVVADRIYRLDSEYRTTELAGKKLNEQVGLLMQYEFPENPHPTGVIAPTSGGMTVKPEPCCFPSALTNCVFYVKSNQTYKIDFYTPSYNPTGQ